jgi:hypothetical protein
VPNVGYATIQIIPSVRGISDELRRQLVGPAGDAGGDAGEAAGGGLRDGIKAGAIAAGVAAGALLAAGIVEAMEQANVTAKLQAQLGATSKDASRFGKIAGQLYSKGVTESFEQGAEAIRSVVNAGLVKPDATNKQLESIAAKMTDVATTFGTDMSLQTQAVSALLKNGLAPSAEDALDVITVGFQKLGPNAEDLLETFQEYPVQLKKLGLDAKESLGLFRQGLQGGARDTDIIADAFKEFSIRAIDMSTGSVDAYKLIGLNAEKMSLQIAKGGDGAQAGLQLVLDKLRAIKDPVKQNAAAVGLFGTQAEELGTALFKLDPGKAAGGFEKVTGAAATLGKTLHSGPSHEIEVFTRSLKQGFVEFLGGQVVPTISEVAHAFNTYLLPPIRAVASVVAAVLLPALAVLWKAGQAVVGWLRDMNTWLIPIGIAVVGLAIAMNTQAIATAAVTAVFAVYRAAMLVGAAVTNGFAGAQALLNAVMAANPIVLIVTLIIALGAALVIAYQKSETFRKIVQGAWQGIQTAAQWAWNNVLKPALDGIVVAFRAVATAATWLWQNVLSPVFAFISTAARILLTAVVVIALLPIIAIFKLLAATATWLWKNILSPVFTAIGDLAVWLYRTVLKPAFDNIVAAIKLVGSVASWLWKNVFSPVFTWIGDKVSSAWKGFIKPAFDLLRIGLQVTGDKARWIWDKVFSPVFTWIGDKGKWLWDKALKPAFDNIKTAVGLVGDAFGKAKDAIKKAWDKVQDIAKKPVKWIIENVYNAGIVPVWNKVAGAFGAPKIETMNLKGWATGGVLPGYTPGRDVHLAALSGGEAVMRPEWTRAVGPGYVNSMNAAARGGGIRGVQRALGLPGFADGGIFGWIGNTASKGLDLAKSGVSWLKDGIKASAMAGMNSIVKPLIDKIAGSASMYRDMISGVPKRMLHAIFDFSGKADSKLADAGIGGKGYKAGLSWARTQAGKKYQWGGNGNPSWDCSGFLSAIESVIRGQKPHRRWATGAFSGAAAPGGWKLGARSPYMIGITNAGVGHTAGTLNGVNVESRGGDGVIVGKRARSYMDPLFTDIYGLKYDRGGWLQPGVTQTVNATGRPEAVLTARQWDVAARAVEFNAGALEGLQVAVFVGNEEISHIARTEVRRANGQLVQTLRAGRRG